jgi:hypothetical protein
MTFRTSFEPKYHTGDRVRVIRESTGVPLGSEWTVVSRSGECLLLVDGPRSRYVEPADLEPAPPGVLDASVPTCDTKGMQHPRARCDAARWVS